MSQTWIVDVKTRRRFQLTRRERGAWGSQWSPDGKWLAFLRSRKDPQDEPGDKGKRSGKVAETQIWLISPLGAGRHLFSGGSEDRFSPVPPGPGGRGDHPDQRRRFEEARRFELEVC